MSFVYIVFEYQEIDGYTKAAIYGIFDTKKEAFKCAKSNDRDELMVMEIKLNHHYPSDMQYSPTWIPNLNLKFNTKLNKWEADL